MSNIQLKLSENKKIKYLEQKVVGRIGEKNLTTIDVYLQKADFKTPYVIPTDATVKFIAETNTNNYTDGYASIVDGEKGFIQYTFTEDNFSDSSGKGKRPFKAAYFELETSDGNRVTFQDFEVYVLPRADISADQATYYVSSLEKILSTFQVTFDQFIRDNTVTYDEFYEKYNNLIRRINESDSKADDVVSKVNAALIEFETGDFFNKQESSANVIYQVIGKEKAEITFRLDAKSEFVKVSSVGYTTLLSPTNVSWTPLTEEQLNNLSSLDGSLYSARDVAANYMKQLKYDCDILGFFKSLLGEKFFTIRGATTDSQKVEVLESLITDFTSNVYGYGSGGGINKLTHRNWNGTWTVSDSTAANEVTRIGQIIESTDTNWKKLINGGKISVLSNSEPTISPNYSTVNIDYLCLDVTIELSANEHFEYMIATYHGENLATQDEAEEGLNESKTMTPVRVFQAIAKWIANKFVSVAGNETILGIKNFTGGLLVSDKRVLTVDDILQTSGTIPLINGNTGVLKYTKQLKNVTLTFNGLNGKYGGTPSGSTLANLPADLRPANYFEELVGSTDRGAVNTAALSFATTGEINWQRNSSTASDYSFEVTYQTI
ncbi:BppU family phage baseplate upper protein [Enterococcus avium]|uniref:BppU family phage baseplate upper protein n=1 Tax=Enterococcus avium TaxID=33945 RepID=UPI0032E4C98A